MKTYQNQNQKPNAKKKKNEKILNKGDRNQQLIEKLDLIQD